MEKKNLKTTKEGRDLTITLRSILCNLSLAEKSGVDLGFFGRLAKLAAEKALEDIDNV